MPQVVFCRLNLLPVDIYPPVHKARMMDIEGRSPRHACMNKTTHCPIFIIGYPRSGTTLLRAILGQHSMLTMFHEPEVFHGIVKAKQHLVDFITMQGVERVLSYLRQKNSSRKYLEGRELRFPRSRLSIRELYEILLGVPSISTPLWGEKSLGNIFYIHHLLRLYPNAIFIHIIRDPRGPSYLTISRKKCIPVNAL